MPQDDDQSEKQIGGEPVSPVGPDDPPIGMIVESEYDAREDAGGAIRSGKLAGRSLTGAIWILALPVLVQQTMQACVGLFDKIIAGNLPDDIVAPAMDGLGIGSYVGWFVGIAMTGLGIGGQALIARSIGGGRVAEAERSLGEAIVMSVLWGFMVGIALWFIAAPLASVCKLSPAASTYCIQYIQTLSYAMPLTAIMMVGGMCLHGAGETTKPSLIAIAVNIVNIIVSWALSGADISVNGRVIENPFSFDLHVTGIAAGTAISYGVGAVLTIMVLVRGVKDLRLQRRDVHLDGVMSRRIMRIGVPNFFEGISMWSVNLFVLVFIGTIGRHSGDAEGLQGAHIIAIQWEAFSFMPGFAIGIAAGALAGQYLGAGNPRMAQRAILTCVGIGAVIMVSLGVVFILGGELLTRIVSHEPIHLEHTPRLLAICGVMQFFFAVTMVTRQGLRGVGDTKWTFIITTVSSYGVRLPAAYLLGVHFGWGLEGVWIALCGEFVVRAALFSTRFFHGGWKKLRI